MPKSDPVPQKADDVVAWITVRMHDGGAVSISGTIADPKFAKKLLDAAKEAIGRQIPERGVLVPPRDVAIDAPQYLTPVGDMARDARGDG